MDADYSFYVKIIETHASAFSKVIIFSIGSVSGEGFGTFFCRDLSQSENFSEIKPPLESSDILKTIWGLVQA